LWSSVLSSWREPVPDTQGTIAAWCPAKPRPPSRFMFSTVSTSFTCTYVIIIVFLFHLLWKGEDSVDTYQSETKFPYSQETLDQNVHYGLIILNSDCHDQMVSPFCFQSISVPSRLVVSALRQKWKSFIHIQSCISKLKQLRKGISSFARNFEVILAFKDNFYCTKEEILFYIYIFVWIQYVLLEFIWKIL